MALADEVSDWVLVFLINFEEFDSNCAFPPGGFVYDSIASFRYLFSESDLLKRDFHAAIKGARIQNLWELKLAFLLCLNFHVLFIFIAEQLFENFSLSL